ncbi:competence protein ComK [Niallia taxi]|nr:competence protein ComK [Niallia taxi]MCM3216382.1 competence protein ComK [Niallia taxi]MDK8640233.1 competence protein ComK [Niallia taxi]MED4039139.1 competence protein ComK [Niallia taxi]
MEKICNDYEISEKTLALIPAYNLEYGTIAMEGKEEYYVKKTPLELIKHAALIGGAEYDGRRSSMSFLTGIKRKVPIPINPRKNIYAFPTQSPSQMDCHWIFFSHVNLISAAASVTNKETTVLFQNGQKLQLKASPHTLDKQMYRTWMCVKALSGDLPVMP